MHAHFYRVLCIIIIYTQLENLKRIIKIKYCCATLLLSIVQTATHVIYQFSCIKINNIVTTVAIILNQCTMYFACNNL